MARIAIPDDAVCVEHVVASAGAIEVADGLTLGPTRCLDGGLVAVTVAGGRSAASEAMERYAAGDVAAFVLVYDELAPRLHRYLVRLTRNSDAAADLLQRVFLKIHVARGRFEPGAKVEPWAYAIARRLFIDSLRRNRLAPSPPNDELLAGNHDTESLARAGQLSRALTAELERLPPQQREAFVLVRYEQLSVAEAAEVLCTTEAAVKLRAHRAYVFLRERLGEFRVQEEPG